MKRMLIAAGALTLLAFAAAPTTPSDAYRAELVKVIQHIDENDARAVIQHKATRLWVLGGREIFPGFAELLAGKKVRLIIGSDDMASSAEWINRIPDSTLEVEICVVPGTTAWGMVLGNPEPREKRDLPTFFLAVDTRQGGFLYSHDPRIVGPIQSMVFQQFVAIAHTYFEMAKRGEYTNSNYAHFIKMVRPPSACSVVHRAD